MSDTDGNLKRWIEEATDGEPIEAVVIGEMGWGDYASESVPNYNTHIRGKVLTWEQAAPMLDYDFDTGFGAPECEAIYAWTASRILLISQYDGATHPHVIPRHPVDCMPIMPGG